MLIIQNCLGKLHELEDPKCTSFSSKRNGETFQLETYSSIHCRVSGTKCGRACADEMN